MHILRLPYLHQKQKRRSGWDSSAAGWTRGEPSARCVCRWAPGGSSCRSAARSCGHELAGSCWWSEAAERRERENVWIQKKLMKDLTRTSNTKRTGVKEVERDRKRDGKKEEDGVGDNLANVCARVSVRPGNRECLWRDALTENDQCSALAFKQESIREWRGEESVNTYTIFFFPVSSLSTSESVWICV